MPVNSKFLWQKSSSGPIEATVLGNLVLQLMATKEIDGLQRARDIIAKSQNIEVYEPQNVEEWNNAYKKFLDII